MPSRWYVLDSLDPNYASVLSALQTATAAKYSGTVLQSVRDAEYDANVKLVKANVLGSELIGDLAPLAKSLEGTGVYLESFDTLVEHQRWAFNHVGDPNPSTGTVRKTYYLRSNHEQATVGGTITTRSDGTTGRNFADAVFSQTLDGLVGLPASDYDIVVCGDLFYAAGAGHTSTSKAFSVKQGCRVFFDKTGHRGCLFGAMLLGDGYGGGWTNVSGDVWSTTITGVNANSGPGSLPKHYWARDKLDGDYGMLLDWASSQAEMEANEDFIWASAFANGNTVFVHMPAGQTPDRRIFMGTGNLDQGPMPRVSGSHPTGVEFYAEKWLMNQRVDEENFYDGGKWFRGQNNENGMTRKGGMFGLRIKDGAKRITGPTIFGRHFSECAFGGFYPSFGDPTKGMTGAYFEDCESYDIGGVNPSQANGDGHADGCQNGPFLNATYRGRYWAIRCGAPVNFYSLEADNNPASGVRLGDDFSGMDWDCDDVIIRDHSAHWGGTIGGSASDVGFHFAGDNEALPTLDGVSVKLSGVIEGFKHCFRFKHPYLVTLASHTPGGLVLKKGTYPNADSSGIVGKLGPNIETVTLSGSSGNWAVGNNLEDPDNPGEAAGTVTRVVGANPTVTLEYRKAAFRGTPVFVSAETVNNLDDTGTGTANGNSSVLGRSGGNIDYSNLRFEADLDRFYESDIGIVPVSNATVPHTHGTHVRARNNIYVGSVTIGKFRFSGADYDFAGWIGITPSADNEHDTTGSTNPAS